LCTLPQRAIDYVLRVGGATLADCDAVVAVGSVVYHPARPLRNLTTADVLAQMPGVDAARVSVLNHHLAHAVGAFMASPFKDAAILVADGAGNVLADASSRWTIPTVEHTSFYHARGATIRELGKVASRPRALNSLGAMYELATLFAGFGKFEEGKTMGLAPYGTPALATEWERAIRFNGELQYRIDPCHQTFDMRGRIIPKSFIQRYGPPRHHSEALRPIDRDIAFAAQHALETTLIHLARALRGQTGCANLLLAGGVALNSVANQKIAETAGFDRVFIVPCAADDGTALGAALWPDFRGEGERSWQMRHAYLGGAYGDDEIERTLRQHDDALAWSRPADLPRETAQRLAAGEIVGWFQGGAEIGPRALGHRSILADPRDPQMKNRLNERVKYRESFRPFAPAVLAERAAEYFVCADTSPFMLRVAKVKRPQEIPAVTHVDGTGRLQTVTAADNDLFYDVIRAFADLTGVPVVLNTSFNLAGDPIVETPGDAVDCFLKADMDALALGSFLVAKKNPALSRQLARQHRELQTLRQKAAAQELELEQIRQSKGWRLLTAVNRVRRS
jgi:carbamoyltransferase